MTIMKRPLGVIIFGCLLIFTSIKLLQYMSGYEFYAQVNHEWPDPVIRIRYIGSYIFRILGLVCGVGVLCLNEPVRKVLVGFSWYCIVTLPLRHTYQANFFFCEPIYHQYGSSMSLEMFTWCVTIIRWLIDGIFSAAVIFYFTRPAVKKHFLKEVQTG